MIDIVYFLERLADLTKKNQSGLTSGQDQTGQINQCQLELAEYLYSIYEINQRAVDLIAPLIKPPQTVSSNGDGLIPYPADYNHLLALRYNKTSSQQYKTQYIGTNQVSIIDRIPQRRADLSKNKVNYTFTSAGIVVYPKQPLNFEMVYIKYPTDAKISYTYTDVNGEPKRTVDTANTVNMDWGMNVFNLLLYMVMDKKGLEVRDLLLNEYAQLGIQKESVKPIN